jgi:hypothetical protein
MAIEHLSRTRASRSRRPRNPWPIIIAIMTVIGAVGGTLIARH